MSYLGKVFKFDRQDNYDDFIKALGISTTDSENFLNYKPDMKLTKSGDSYTISYIAGDKTKDITFTPGQKFKEFIRDGFEADTLFTVSGDTFTQVQDFGPKGTITLKRTFSDNEVVMELTASIWDGGVARRYYKA